MIWLFRWLIVRIMLGAAADQAARRPVLARLHVPRLPLRDAADPQPAQLVAARAAALVPRRRRRLQPLRRAGRAVLRARGARACVALAGICFVAFQVILILSGNLSFLNWLTIVPALACFDDRPLAPAPPAPACARALARGAGARAVALAPAVAVALAGVVALLSIEPVLNLLSPHQAMNRSFDRLHLVNTYGAFGAVGRERDEVILEGTSDAQLGPDTRVARVRVSLQARRRRAAAVRDLALPLPARLAALVRRDVVDRARAVAGAAGRRSCCAATPA